MFDNKHVEEVLKKLNKSITISEGDQKKIIIQCLKLQHMVYDSNASSTRANKRFNKLSKVYKKRDQVFVIACLYRTLVLLGIPIPINRFKVIFDLTSSNNSNNSSSSNNKVKFNRDCKIIKQIYDNHVCTKKQNIDLILGNVFFGSSTRVGASEDVNTNNIGAGLKIDASNTANLEVGANPRFDHGVDDKVNFKIDARRDIGNVKIDTNTAAAAAVAVDMMNQQQHDLLQIIDNYVTCEPTVLEKDNHSIDAYCHQLKLGQEIIDEAKRLNSIVNEWRVLENNRPVTRVLTLIYLALCNLNEVTKVDINKLAGLGGIDVSTIKIAYKNICESIPRDLLSIKTKSTILLDLKKESAELIKLK